MTKSSHAPFLAFLLAAAAVAQTPAPPAPAPAVAPAATFVLEPGNHALGKLTDRVAAFLDCNILYSAPELEACGELRITRKTEVDAKGCWELFGTLLCHKGIAVVTLDEARGFHELIVMNGPRGREIANGAMFVEVDRVEAFAKLKATPILTSVPLRNIDATIATNALRPFFAGMGPNAGMLTLGNVGNDTSILIQGFGPQVAAACRLLRLVDGGSLDTGEQMVVVRLKNAAAADLAATLETTWATRAAQVSPQMPGRLRPTGNLRVVAHPPLNSLVLHGTGSQLREAQQLIDALDQPAVTPPVPSNELLRRIQALEERLQPRPGKQ